LPRKNEATNAKRKIPATAASAILASNGMSRTRIAQVLEARALDV
jgi:hypothetical protein